MRGIVHHPEVEGGLTLAGHAMIGSILGKPLGMPGGKQVPEHGTGRAVVE